MCINYMPVHTDNILTCLPHWVFSCPVRSALYPTVTRSLSKTVLHLLYSSIILLVTHRLGLKRSSNS